MVLERSNQAGGIEVTDPLNKYDKKSLAAYIEHVEAQLKAARAEIERLSLDVHLLSEELEIARRPKMDER